MARGAPLKRKSPYVKVAFATIRGPASTDAGGSARTNPAAVRPGRSSDLPRSRVARERDAAQAEAAVLRPGEWPIRGRSCQRRFLAAPHGRASRAGGVVPPSSVIRAPDDWPPDRASRRWTRASGRLQPCEAALEKLLERRPRHLARGAKSVCTHPK